MNQKTTDRENFNEDKKKHFILYYSYPVYIATLLPETEFSLVRNIIIIMII